MYNVAENCHCLPDDLVGLVEFVKQWYFSETVRLAAERRCNCPIHAHRQPMIVELVKHFGNVEIGNREQYSINGT